MGWSGFLGRSALPCVLALLGLPAPGHAEDSDEWIWEVGLSTGWATSRGQRVIPVMPRVELHWGDSDRFGNLYATLEGNALIQYQPSGGHASGASLLFGYVLPDLGPLRPFVEGGAGLLGVEMDRPRQRDGFNFSTQVGGGLRVPLGARFSLVASYRYIHVSNAGTKMPNGGFDFQTGMLGFSYRLD